MFDGHLGRKESLKTRGIVESNLEWIPSSKVGPKPETKPAICEDIQRRDVRHKYPRLDTNHKYLTDYSRTRGVASNEGVRFGKCNVETDNNEIR